ncbi:MAG: hypothetical protein K2N56_00385 [Oscillospiraceae bacterium]|nr:hypothetical protein [Oscillospiraceae bacterium]
MINSKHETYLNLQPLRIPPHWTMELNKLEDIDPETLPPEDKTWLFAFNEDILHMYSIISRKRNKQTEEQKLGIDLGWYPDGDPNGNFVLQAVLNEDWLDPLMKFSSRNKNEIVNTLEKWLWKDLMPVRFIDEEYFHKNHKIKFKP